MSMREDYGQMGLKKIWLVWNLRRIFISCMRFLLSDIFPDIPEQFLPGAGDINMSQSRRDKFVCGKRR